MRIKDGDGRYLICAELYHLPELVNELKNNWVYCYYYGRKLESGMSEEEIYKWIYTSKEQYQKDFPDGCFYEEEKRTKRLINLDIFMDEINDFKPDLYEILLKRKTEGEIIEVDQVSLQLLLDLNHGISYDELAYLLSEHGSSGYTHSFYTNFLLEYSPKGKDFVEYLINEKGYSVYQNYINNEEDKKIL